MKAFLRILYRQLIAIISCCSFTTMLTGIIIRLSDRLIQLPDLAIKSLISIHQGAFLGNEIAPIYVLLLGLGVLFLSLKVVVKGRYNLLFQSLPPLIANISRIVVLILIVPLAVCVETGVAYRLGVDWFGMSSQETTKFLSIHGGSFFGESLGIYYLLAVSAVLITILSLNRKKKRIPSEKIRQTLQQQIGKTKTKLSKKPTKSTIAIVYILIAILGILYYATSILFVAIAIGIIVIILSVVFLYKNFFKGRQQQRKTSTMLHEHEAESITMLKAIPDSILRISQNGICLSYMPAKEATSFVLYGDIVHKHISEFLAPEIAGQFMASAQSALETGSTDICRFPILLNNQKQYYEARITPIGETEVLILVRELAHSDYASIVEEQFVTSSKDTAAQLLTESELIHILETTLSDESDKNHTLLCITIDTETINTDAFAIGNADAAVVDRNLILQIVAEINSLLPSSAISLLDDNNLTVLVSDCTMENASILADHLNRNLRELFTISPNNSHPIKFNIALLEINTNNLDAVAWVDAAKVASQMAKQKVNFRTFG